MPARDFSVLPASADVHEYRTWWFDTIYGCFEFRWYDGSTIVSVWTDGDRPAGLYEIDCWTYMEPPRVEDVRASINEWWKEAIAAQERDGTID